jgi:hypothetical protein
MRYDLIACVVLRTNVCIYEKLSIVGYSGDDNDITNNSIFDVKYAIMLFSNKKWLFHGTNNCRC